jgi:uncharacterized protein YbcV (DUF1398 family)
MIKTPKNIEGWKVNVFLLNGKEYLGKDVASNNPFGAAENLVYFWENDNCIMVIPMREVSKVEICFEEPAK